MTELSTQQISEPKFQGNHFGFSMMWKKQIKVARLQAGYKQKQVAF